MALNLSEKNVLVAEVVSELRNKHTPPTLFRRYLRMLGTYMAYEVASLLETEETTVETPLGIAKARKHKDTIIVITVLRAAVPMAEGVIEQFSTASMGFVSASRGKMLEPGGKDFRIDVTYFNVPKLEGNIAIIVDPMLASASTLLYILERVSEQNPKQIIILSAIASTYGIKRIKDRFPDVIIFAGDIDEYLNEKGYIVPGLGDAGDRAFNT